ncbi:unnamed protein product [Rotaria sp. Silwood2]|nr:unnamed protein product [Rotaria sp. Silwood2]CAF4453546.1 unnamed protein product [Rotaria sp. Silwood2]
MIEHFYLASSKTTESSNSQSSSQQRPACPRCDFHDRVYNYRSYGLFNSDSGANIYHDLARAARAMASGAFDPDATDDEDHGVIHLHADYAYAVLDLYDITTAAVVAGDVDNVVCRRRHYCVFRCKNDDGVYLCNRRH